MPLYLQFEKITNTFMKQYTIYYIIKYDVLS